MDEKEREILAEIRHGFRLLAMAVLTADRDGLNLGDAEDWLNHCDAFLKEELPSQVLEKEKGAS